jgi:predicted P-loop ATPase
VGEGVDEYPNDPESIQYVSYDCSRLFVEGSDHPFFADRLFANRLVNHVEALRSGAQQNKIYIFDGPHGCGKSTFLNNLLKRFEEYANTDAGKRYETVWRLDRSQLEHEGGNETASILESLFRMQQNSDKKQFETVRNPWPWPTRTIHLWRFPAPAMTIRC